MASTKARFGSTLLLSVLMATSLHASTVIQQENAKPGTAAWQLTLNATNHEIEGYASLTSVNRGGTINFFVKSSDSTYNADVYRMGWYGGTGGRLVTSLSSLSRRSQPNCPQDNTTYRIECNWHQSFSLTIPNDADATDWASGFYLVKLTGTSSGKQHYIVFVVRDDARSSTYFFISAANTYQAYNPWGGKSLYSFNSTGTPARKVSFNRPYDLVNGIADGSGSFLGGWEYNTVRFLEHEGYDVTYGTDVDLHENANLLLSHQAAMSVGHQEYWSWEMRANMTAARDSGVGLGFLGANMCYWQVRYETSSTGQADRTLVGYKDFAQAEDPNYNSSNPSVQERTTTLWRNYPVNLPEELLVGVMYVYDPVDADIVVTDATDPLFNTTGIQNGQHLTELLGYEVDQVFTPGDVVGRIVLAHSPYSCPTGTCYSDMSLYTTATGTPVFATGSMQWSWGLDAYNTPLLHANRVDPAVQQTTRNVLAKLIRDLPPVANPGGPYAALANTPVNFDGSGSGDPDGVVMSWEWDFGDGATATGAMPTHAYATPGTYTVSLIVTDDKGARNRATTTVTANAFFMRLSSLCCIVPLPLANGQPLNGHTTPVPTITVAGTPAAGGKTNAQFTVTIIAAPGYNGTIQFSIDGQPKHMSGDFSPSSVKGGGSSQLTLTAKNPVDSGSYFVTVIASDGSQTASVLVGVVVP